MAQLAAAPANTSEMRFRVCLPSIDLQSNEKNIIENWENGKFKIVLFGKVGVLGKIDVIGKIICSPFCC